MEDTPVEFNLGEAQTSQPEAPTSTQEQEVTLKPTSWADSLPEDLRKEASISKFKDVAGLAKSYLEAEKRMSSSVRIPNENSTPEELSKFYSKLGRPESVDKYDISLNTGETPDTSPGVAALLNTAFEAGLTQRQAAAILGVYDKLAMEHIAATEKAAVEAKEALRKEWGADTEANLHAANVALKKFGERFPKEVAALSRNSEFANNPVIISMFSEMGRRMQEGKSAQMPGDISMKTPKALAAEKIQEVKGNPNHPYWNVYHPEHHKAKLEMDKLYSVK
jgi:hypothetical protein